MTGSMCSCEALEQNLQERLEEWRHICSRFFYDHDAEAKALLEYFESDKIDQIIIEPIAATAGPESTVHATITRLGLRKCSTPSHDQYFQRTVEAFERVKNEVRGGYHRSVAQRKYAEFGVHVSAQQGTNYEMNAGQSSLVVRELKGYNRSLEKFQYLSTEVEAFVHKFGHAMGCHPFLLGLQELLRLNLLNSTIVAWKISDAVFIETGGQEFMEASVKLLVQVLNFNHQIVEGADERTTATAVHHRMWYIDPYLSDHDIRKLLRLFPPRSRLEGSPTGEHIPTTLNRMNKRGEFDEEEPFFQRWCVIL